MPYVKKSAHDRDMYMNYCINIIVKLFFSFDFTKNEFFNSLFFHLSFPFHSELAGACMLQNDIFT